MGWQDEIKDILEQSNWPPKVSEIQSSAWPRIVALAVLGWVLAEMFSRLESGARDQARSSAA